MIPFAVPDITNREIEAVAKAMEGGWITSGPQMRLFEQEAQEWLNTSRTCLAANSATAGLLLALEYLQLQGKPVLVPDITFVASIETIVQAGGRPVIGDVRADDLCLSLHAVTKAHKQEPLGAVVLVHFAGAVPIDRTEIVKYCLSERIPLIEDAAHSFGAEDALCRIGASDDSLATVFSFYATKCITTGEGGMVVSGNPGLIQHVQRGRLHGISRDAFNRYRDSGGAWEYDVTQVGWKANMPDTAAAMGRVQLLREEEMRIRRMEIARRYDELLPEEILRPYYHAGHCRHLYPIQLPPTVDRGGFIASMTSQGVGMSVHFKPLHRLSAYSDDVKKYPVSEQYWQSACSLPLYSQLSNAQVETILEAVACSMNRS